MRLPAPIVPGVSTTAEVMDSSAAGVLESEPPAEVFEAAKRVAFSGDAAAATLMLWRWAVANPSRIARLMSFASSLAHAWEGERERRGITP